MPQPDICGFVVVRLPEFDEGRFHLRPPPIEGKVYRGIDRLRWEISERVEEATQSEMRALIRSNRQWPFDSPFGYGITPHLHVAEEFMRHDEKANEILAVYSQRLAEVSGLIQCGRRFEFLGHEVHAVGEWSPHWDGVFRHPHAFSEVLPLLNQNGLFDTDEGVDLLAGRYVALMRKGIVEPLADPPDFETLRLYRVF